MSQDATLVNRLKAGDLDALGVLYDMYHQRVFHTALAITRDPAAAEDILQDAFLRLHTYIDRVDTSFPLMPWLYRITVNLSYTWVTRRNRWSAPLEDFVERLVGPMTHHPEPEAERREELRLMQKAIESLAFSQRAVVVLHYLNDLSLQEIATILDCPVGTVKSRLHYGRENLRAYLERGDSASETPPLGVPLYEFT